MAKKEDESEKIPQSSKKSNTKYRHQQHMCPFLTSTLRFPETASENLPGPGAFDSGSPLDSRNLGFAVQTGSRFREIKDLLKETHQIPGPGAYDICQPNFDHHSKEATFGVRRSLKKSDVPDYLLGPQDTMNLPTYNVTASPRRGDEL